MLTGAELDLRTDLLRPWANWVTPAGHTRRYDTFFFAAALPDGQQARLLTSEADLGQWRAPQALLAEYDVGAVQLMPPTLAMLTDLAGAGSVAEVMAARRVVTPVRFREPGGVGLRSALSAQSALRFPPSGSPQHRARRHEAKGLVMTGLSGPIRRLTEHASVLLAPNAGPMTLDGTNSYLLWSELSVRGRGPTDAGRRPPEGRRRSWSIPDRTTPLTWPVWPRPAWSN